MLQILPHTHVLFEIKTDPVESFFWLCSKGPNLQKILLSNMKMNHYISTLNVHHENITVFNAALNIMQKYENHPFSYCLL